jgi:hypothetical protein
MSRVGESANTREEPKNLRPYVDEFRTAVVALAAAA